MLTVIFFGAACCVPIIIVLTLEAEASSKRWHRRLMRWYAARRAARNVPRERWSFSAEPTWLWQPSSARIDSRRRWAARPHQQRAAEIRASGVKPYSLQADQLFAWAGVREPRAAEQPSDDCERAPTVRRRRPMR